MVSMNDLYIKRQEILKLAKQHGADNVRVFGSVARGETKPGSDVDFLVNLEDGRSLIDHIALICDLEELLGCKVDVVSETALHRAIRDKVIAEGVAL